MHKKDKSMILIKALASLPIAGYAILGLFHTPAAKCVTLANPAPVITPQECPMPGLEEKINETLDKYRRSPEKEFLIKHLIRLLSITIPSYNCRRDYDKEPVPAWWLAKDDSIAKWFSFLLERVERSDDSALILLLRFFVSSDGYFKEGLAYRLIDILLNQPTLVLDCWINMRAYDEKLAEIKAFLTAQETARIIDIYQNVGLKDKTLKQKCDEIIGFIKK
jgi:hypothetical protein